jgi:elongation factor G
MKVYDAASLRNVALVGHSGSGKTQLVSALLYDAGAVNRFGKVDDGTTVTDYDEEEIARKHTLSASLAYAEWNKTKINFIDTPGMANFLSDARAALRVADAALVVIDAVHGAEVSTEKVWETADELGVPRVIVLNRLDRERASLERSLESLRGVFGRTVIPIQLPLGEEKNFKGVVDLVTMKAITFSADGSGKPAAADVPAEMSAAAQAAREALIEMVAEADDALMEKFFDAGTLSQEDLVGGLKRGVAAARVFPVVLTSATANVGMQPLLDAIVAYVPSPAERPLKARSAQGDDVEIATRDGAGACAFVWKTVADPFAGRINVFRVLSGSVGSDSNLVNPRTKGKERFGQVLLLQGKEHAPADALQAGDIGAVAKLKDVMTGDLLLEKDDASEAPALDFPQPVMSFAITPKAKGDEEKMATALRRLAEEDPTLVMRRDDQTGEQLLAGLSQMHVEVAVDRLHRRFSVDVDLHQPRVPYLETIRKESRAQGRYKKQTGGRGQFGDCHIVLEPLAGHEGYEFVDKIVGGVIPQGFRPAVDKGIQEAMARGELAGAPVQGVRVVLVDGSYHNVDSSEMAFKIAGSMAFKAAYEKADPVLLEPIMTLEATVPDDAVGAVNGDLNSRRGRLHGMEPRGGMTTIKAEVPMAEVLTYSQSLTSLTGGRGDYALGFLRYEEVPTHIAQKIIETAQKEREEAKAS